MNKKITAFIAAIALLIASFPPMMSYAENGGTEVWMPNPVKVRENLNRGLVAMIDGDGVFLSWRLYADEDALYGTGNENVSFDIYRDGVKIATESKTTNYTDTEGTIESRYQVVISGETPTANTMTVTPFSTGSNYIEIPVITPPPAQLFVPLSEAGATPTPTPDEDDSSSDVDGEETTDTSSDDKSDWVTIEKSYTIGDASTGDLDGDGEYEIVVKWDCNAKDNAHGGHTGNVLLSAYKLDGTQMWDGKFIDLGVNIRAGAHYTQFLVYDFDGDGKAEITCKTAQGSKDADGIYVTKASHDAEISSVTDEYNEVDHRTQYGRVTTGEEYFTAFDGETGAAIDTIYYPNQRLAPSVWGDGDTWGNRVDRFTAAVAYLDGVNPYAVYMRGYYYGRNKQQRQTACAISLDKTTKQLECHLSYDSYDVTKYKNPSGYTSDSFREDGSYKGVIGYEEQYSDYYAQGNHNCSVADVDNDGRDEVLTGAMCYGINSEGNLRPEWTTWKGHGDALHIGDYDPTHDGYEFFVVHEEGSSSKTDHGVTLDYGMSVIDPADGEIIYHEPSGGDNGRGVMADVGMGGYYQFWSGKCDNLQMVTATGDTENGYLTSSKTGLSQNFRIFWDGDLYEELLNNTSITSWNSQKLEMTTIFNAEGCISVNGSKAVPSLTADLFGDWREEVVYATEDNSALRIYTTNIPTDYKMKSLMYDNVYRCGVAAEQSGYNQPPHIGYYTDKGENGMNGVVDEQPKVTLPDDATEISHTVADDYEPATYSQTDETTFGGVKFSIGGTKDKSKYYSVVRAGLEDKVFKIQNGAYAQGPSRCVYVSFPEEIELEEGQTCGLAFAVKLFDGTDGYKTKCRLSFLSETGVNTNWTDYSHRITSFTTDDLAEGEWGIVRYEFSGSQYFLYLNDKLIDVGNTTAGMPILGITFCNSNKYQPYTCMILDDVYTYKKNVPVSRAVYERGNDTSILWSEADADSWTETKNGDIVLNYDTENQRLLYDPYQPRSSNTASKTFTVSEDASTLIYDIDWYFGSSTAYSTNYEFIKFGDNLQFSWHQYYVLNRSIDGGTTNTRITQLANSYYTKNIHLEIDRKDNTIKQLLFDGSYIMDYTGMEVTNPETVSFGLHGAKNTGGWVLPTGISNITVSEIVNKHTLESIKVDNLPIRTTYKVNAPFDYTEMVVKAKYDDGTERTLDKDEYTLSGFDSSGTGTQTVTVSYTEDGITKTDEFDVLIAEGAVALLDGRYRQYQVMSDIAVDWDIGAHTGDFIIEHETTVYSIPPDGSSAKDDTSGFNVVFYPAGETTSGAGWYLTSTENDRVSVIWKSANTTTVANNNIMVGETYTFRYEFSDVGTDNGAAVKMSIIDSEGNVVASKDNLSLRTMSAGGANMNMPLQNAIVYLESTDDRKCDVDISNSHDIQREAMPAVTIDYENETVTGFETDADYTINGRTVTVAGGSISAAPYTGSTIEIIKNGDGINTADSRAFTLMVDERPEKPSGLETTPETNTNRDGAITNTTPTMEYSADGESWTDTTDLSTTGLSAGTYYVRYKSTETEFASKSAVVTIGKQDEFTVVFMNGDEAVSTQSVLANGIPEAPEAPERTATAQYTYTFAGWSTNEYSETGTTEMTAITENTTYYAVYTKTVNQYTVKWHNENGDEIKSDSAEYNSVPVYSGAAPEKEPSVQYTYTFAGWAAVKGGEIIDGGLPAVTGDADYYAVFNASLREYTITWNWHNNHKSETLAYGTEITAPEDPEDYTEGTVQYTFDIWEPSPEGIVTGDAVFNALYGSAAITYDITYILNYHTADAQTEAYDKYAAGASAELPVLTEEGWTFVGWYSDEECTQEAQITESTTGNQTFYAKWEQNKYTVTWVNGDDVTETDNDVLHGSNPSYDGDTPEKAADAQYSYEFIGWTDIAGDETVKSPLPEVTENVTYYALYKRSVNKYTVTWVIDDETVETDENIEFGTVPEYNGETEKTEDAQYTYDFAGWTNIENGSVAKFTDGALPKVDGNTTYYAVYNKTIKAYKIIWKNGSDTLKEETLEYGVKPLYTGDTPQKEADEQYTYTFEGWTTEENSVITKFWVNDVPKVTDNATYYATFKGTKKKYTVTWSIGNDILKTETVSYNSAVPEYSGDEPSKAQDNGYTYTFAGWSKTDGGELIDIQNEAVRGNVWYYAVFTPKAREYTVAYETDKGTVPDSAKYTYNIEYTLADAPDNITGYSFRGWHDKSDIDNPQSTVLAIAAGTYGDKTYSALWETEEYTVTFDSDGGSEVAPQTVAYGGKASAPAAPSKTGYGFVKWQLDGSDYDFDTAVSGNITLKAVWNINQYTITWQNDNHQTITTTTVNHGDIPVPPAEPSKHNPNPDYIYTFNGWSPEITAATQDETYTATFTAEERDLSVEIPVLTPFDNIITLRRKSGNNGAVTITAASKENMPLPSIKGYLAIYNGTSLISVELVAFTENSASISEPQLADGESCRLFIWTEDNEPVTASLTNLFN